MPPSERRQRREDDKCLKRPPQQIQALGCTAEFIICLQEHSQIAQRIVLPMPIDKVQILVLEQVVLYTLLLLLLIETTRRQRDQGTTPLAATNKRIRLYSGLARGSSRLRGVFLRSMQPVSNRPVQIPQEQIEDVVVNAPVLLNLLEAQKRHLSAVLCDATRDVYAATNANDVNAEGGEEACDSAGDET